jgi:hypothetical protein
MAGKMTDTNPENGIEPRWTGSKKFAKDSIRQLRAYALFLSTNWDALVKCMSERYETCEIDEGYAIGGDTWFEVSSLRTIAAGLYEFEYRLLN